MHQVGEDEAAEIISSSEEKKEHSDEHETLRLKWKIGDQPTDDGDGDNRTERSNDHKAQQAAKISRGWPAASEARSPRRARPECHQGANH
jgi:hypothetical protein